MGDELDVGDSLLTVYAEKEPKLAQARAFYTDTEPVQLLPSGEAIVEQL